LPTNRESVVGDLEEWNDWVIARPFGHPISINKVHAFQYGLFWGISVGLTMTISWSIAVWLTLFTVAGAFGVFRMIMTAIITLSPREPDKVKTTIAMLSIYHKPHYFLSVYFPSLAITNLLL
jgi:hypothetical protein